jgi:methyltransferase-like protein/ubiquinone/menaquinone biosynthesis C-methylase UbiE
MASLYDQVAYRGFPFQQTHPDRLAAIARLHGMTPAPVEGSRVLELACGDGGNLIPMAAALPGSSFVGVDLAEVPVTAGNRIVSALGLSNIALKAGDLREVGPAWGQFDYIIAHGIYAWVPAALQDDILRVLQECLSPEGVAFVSYNALPGARVRQAIREMMLYRTRGIAEPGERAAAALGFVRSLASSLDSMTNGDELLGRELRRMSERGVWALFHDELAEVYAPVYFHEFVAHAGRHGLQYLAEADFHDLNEGGLGPQLDELGGDFIEREQYADFIKGRRFRQTLLCRAEVSLTRQVRPEICRRLFMASAAEAVSEEPDFEDGVEEEFRGARGAVMKTAHPVAKLALAQLIARWPVAVGFEELDRLTRPMAETDEDLERILLACFSAGLVELHCWAAPVTGAAGERPRVWSVGRYQAAQLVQSGQTERAFLTSLWHASVEMRGRLDLEVVRLLDGSRDRAAVVEALRFVFEKGVTKKRLVADVEECLGRLARMGLLERNAE